MHYSGLALAGAQVTLEAWRRGETPSRENDGIVTAEDVSTLNLNGKTWLVTLSASAKQDWAKPRRGEGVLGLRRGVIQAGAENLLMTLWKIDDEATVDIMLEFYEAAHTSGNAPQSLADIQRDWLVKLRKTERAPKGGKPRRAVHHELTGKTLNHVANAELLQSRDGLSLCWILHRGRHVF